MDGRRRDNNSFYPRYANGDLNLNRLREMDPIRALPPPSSSFSSSSSSRYKRERRRTIPQRPNPHKLDLDPNLINHLLFLINQNPRDLLIKLDELRDHLSRRTLLSSSSFGHHHYNNNHLSAFSELGSPRNHFSSPPHHRHLPPNRRHLQSFNERYRRVRATRDNYGQYSHNACSSSSSSYADSQHNFDNNNNNSYYYAPAAERLLLGSQDHERRSVINSINSPRVESAKRRAKSYRPMNGASPFAICDGCFALLQIPAGFAFDRHRRKNSQFKCGSCSKVFGVKLPTKGKHDFGESRSIGSSTKSWNNFSRERVYSKDVKPVSLSTSHDFERESNYGSSDAESLRRDTNERYYLEASSGTYEARDVSINEVLEDSGDTNEKYYLEGSSGTYEARDVSVSEVVEDSRERTMVEELEKDERKSYIEDVKQTVEIDQSADVQISGEIVIVGTSGNEETEAKGEIGISTEPIEIETKNDFYMPTINAEDTLNVTVPNESVGNKEDTENSPEDVPPVEIEEISAADTDTDTVALKGNTNEHNNNTAEVNNASFEIASIASSSCKESSRGSFEVRLDEEQQQSVGAKNGDSFLGGFKRSFKELPLFNRATERSKCRVWVNGRPISDRAVKRAEKKAGPVDPGDYWYDYRAGFWGVMGHQCLGIIPPFIKEFNYPMPQNCAGGATGVLVNGRELHQKDLALLVGRGLPSIPGRSYTIEMSGKVVDDATGKELRNLGKLAPTIEILKRGFGMLVPQDVID